MEIHQNYYSDIFYFAHFGYIVSEDLKNAIQTAKLLDFEFSEIPNASFFFKNMNSF